MIELLMFVLFILMVIMAYFLYKQDEELEELRSEINGLNDILLNCLIEKRENKDENL